MLYQSLTRGFFAYENSQPPTVYRFLGWLAVSALHCYTASEMQAKTGLDDWHIRTCNNWLLRLDECVNGMHLHIPAQHCAKPVSCIPVDTALFILYIGTSFILHTSYKSDDTVTKI